MQCKNKVRDKSNKNAVEYEKEAWIEKEKKGKEWRRNKKTSLSNSSINHLHVLSIIVKNVRSACTFCLRLHARIASEGVALMHAGGTVLRVHCTSPNTQVNVCSAYTHSELCE
jgi:hypothetical protein